MNYLDLFSGIGGFALGAYKAGWRFHHHCFSEIDTYATKLYKKRFPLSRSLGDIRFINTKKLRLYGSEWCITGGFPCQDISLAGKGVGLTGTRSSLWFEMLRIISDLRPRFVIAENVRALTFRGLDTVLANLAQIGYNAEWQCISAADMGAPHRRERIWIVAYPDSTWKLQSSGIVKKLGGWARDSSEAENADTVCDNGKRELQPCLRSEEKAEQVRFIRANFSNSDDNHNWVECQKGFRAAYWGEAWPTEPAVGRVANGIPRRVDRLRGLGNAIVPQIAELLFRQLHGVTTDEQ